MSSKSPVQTVVRLSRDALIHVDAPGVRRVLGSGNLPISLTTPIQRALLLPPTTEPFHFTRHIWRLCRDVAEQTDELSHIDMRRVLVTFVRCRNRRSWGLQAKLIPMRFRGGKRAEKRRGRLYQVQQLFVGDVEVQYVLSFYLPRFLNQSFEEKIITIFHELYHIGPEFRGDIRRFPGGRSVHSPSSRDYDRQMADLARGYFARRPPRRLYDFLRLSFNELEERYGEVVGVHIPAPKLVPVPRGAAAD
jgi:predicted metallopeptidase